MSMTRRGRSRPRPNGGCLLGCVFPGDGGQLARIRTGWPLLQLAPVPRAYNQPCARERLGAYTRASGSRGCTRRQERSRGGGLQAWRWRLRARDKNMLKRRACTKHQRQPSTADARQAQVASGQPPPADHPGCVPRRARCQLVAAVLVSRFQMSTRCQHLPIRVREIDGT